MKKQMCWLFTKENSSRMVLHLREYSHYSWQPYTAYPQYSVPDYRVPGGAKGWATYQSLRQVGWTFISTDRTYISTEPVRANFSSN